RIVRRCAPHPSLTLGARSAALRGPSLAALARRCLGMAGAKPAALALGYAPKNSVEPHARTSALTAPGLFVAPLPTPRQRSGPAPLRFAVLRSLRSLVEAWEWRDQNPLPYRLATPQKTQSHRNLERQRSQRQDCSSLRSSPLANARGPLRCASRSFARCARSSNLEMAGSKPAALPLGYAPKNSVEPQSRTSALSAGSLRKRACSRSFNRENQSLRRIAAGMTPGREKGRYFPAPWKVCHMKTPAATRIWARPQPASPSRHSPTTSRTRTSSRRISILRGRVRPSSSS